jgi:O-antigen/teichoic acid export membrane protein
MGTMRVPGGNVQRFARNATASIARICVNSVIAFVLPAYLTHHLPVKTYAAWVLILQMSAYVSVMDFGVQAAVAKFIAEYEAKGDHVGTSQCASTGVVIMAAAGCVALVATAFIACYVPRLFHGMPSDLYHDVRLSIILIGSSLSLAIGVSPFSAVFSGLQQYRIPIGISIVNRILYAVAIGFAVSFHKSLVVMSAAVGAINTTTALAQVVAWRVWASRIRIAISAVTSSTFKVMLAYCSVQSIWSIGALLISGMDTTIVGHYAFKETAYYSIALSPNALVIVVLLAGLSPLMPAASALSTQRSPAEMGHLLLRTTRYSVIVLCLTGVSLLVCGYPLLRVWVGVAYAIHSVSYLRILVIANIVRLICAPYSTMVIATGRQRVAMAAVFSEALSNLLFSIWLASRFGAIGVAWGTLIGGAIGLAIHFGVSMRYTQANLRVSRRALFLNGILRPAGILIPSAISAPLWWNRAGSIPNLPAMIVVVIATLAIAWKFALVGDERHRLLRALETKVEVLVERT